MFSSGSNQLTKTRRGEKWWLCLRSRCVWARWIRPLFFLSVWFPCCFWFLLLSLYTGYISYGTDCWCGVLWGALFSVPLFSHSLLFSPQRWRFNECWCGAVMMTASSLFSSSSSSSSPTTRTQQTRTETRRGERKQPREQKKKRKEKKKLNIQKRDASSPRHAARKLVDEKMVY